MNKTIDPEFEQVLDNETLEQLGDALQPVALSDDRRHALRARIMQRIDAEATQPSELFVTIRSDEGDWEEIAPKIHRKVLHFNPDTGVESYLLRAEAGAEAPPHRHDHDELCLVLEGEVDFDDVHLEAGDYHFAARGSRHSAAHTQTGAVLFIQTAVAA